MLAAWRLRPVDEGSDSEVLDLARVTGFELSPQEERERRHAKLWMAQPASGQGPVAGYLLAWEVADEVELLQLATRAEARRQGVASALVRALIDEERRLGKRAIFLEVRLSNLPARALYRQLGFSERGVRKGYYQSPREDAAVLALDLTATG